MSRKCEADTPESLKYYLDDYISSPVKYPDESDLAKFQDQFFRRNIYPGNNNCDRVNVGLCGNRVDVQQILDTNESKSVLGHNIGIKNGNVNVVSIKREKFQDVMRELRDVLNGSSSSVKDISRILGKMRYKFIDNS